MNEFLEKLAVTGLRFLSVLFRLLPESAALAFGAFTGRIFFLFGGKRKRVAYADLKAALGNRLSEPQRWKVLKKHYAHLGKMFIEVLRFPSLNEKVIAKKVRVDDPEKLHLMAGHKRGAVFLTAHFGNWELSQFIVRLIFKKPMHVLARNQKHPHLNALVNELRESHGAVAVARGIGVRGLLRGLHQHDLVGVLGDQDDGRHGGLILPFFGRKTTVPTGAFELACRTGVPVLPTFIVRRKGGRHDLFITQSILCKPGKKIRAEEIEKGLKTFLSRLEEFITRFPEQWMWESKRWKYSWTKRILILSDGKPGHYKQSQAVAAQFSKITHQFDRPGMEYPLQTIEVKFKSGFHRALFPYTALLLLPWIQGRLGWLGGFFEKETAKQIREASADFIISAGSSLTALNLCLKRDNLAKNIVLMKPAFPFNFFKYDLALVPVHDRGAAPPQAVRTVLAPSHMELSLMKESAEKIKPELKDPARIKASLFLGGPTRGYAMKLVDIQKTFASLERMAPRIGDYLVTTSRRTPESISNYLKEKQKEHGACQMLVIGNEDLRKEVVPAMMELADILVVTEDSISMISEALRTQKKVIVLTFPDESLPAKHQRFKDVLLRESVVTSSPDELGEKILLAMEHKAPSLAEDEDRELLRQIQRIL